MRRKRTTTMMGTKERYFAPNIDYHSFYGLGVIVITIQPQKELSYVGEDVYWRVGDTTKRADTAKEITALVQRFR